ncbi:HEXXH motif-containing putative peptide modification protein [Streptomyces sp. NPDC021354]|uniref:aKG-HExxH-type peptide beta-hydroxylase n=1 Tax=Streptomyces sp. NPDC021354 TaxID=3154793 RepID=UPI0033CBE886
MDTALDTGTPGIRPFVPAHCGGWPFLDHEHDPRRLLTAVACVRFARRDGPLPAPTAQDLAAVLTPAEALRIRALDLPKPLPAGTLIPHRQAQVDQTVRLIAELIPDWAPLLSALPLVYVPMPAGRASVSASCFAWPQHVLLADAAFTSPAVLAEQTLHETFHQWLYLCEELASLHHPGCTRRITLPSGTSGRSLAELLGAAHVTVGLARMWPLLDVPAHVRDQRLERLDAYRRGCLRLIGHARPCLTDHGHALADRILEASA